MRYSHLTLVVRLSSRSLTTNGSLTRFGLSVFVTKHTIFNHVSRFYFFKFTITTQTHFPNTNSEVLVWDVWSPDLPVGKLISFGTFTTMCTTKTRQSDSLKFKITFSKFIRYEHKNVFTSDSTNIANYSKQTTHTTQTKNLLTQTHFKHFPTKFLKILNFQKFLIFTVSSKYKINTNLPILTRLSLNSKIWYPLNYCASNPIARDCWQHERFVTTWIWSNYFRSNWIKFPESFRIFETP